MCPDPKAECGETRAFQLQDSRCRVNSRLVTTHSVLFELFIDVAHRDLSF